ncbi:MAG TPA: hypothetical protein VM843_06820 [Flavisolibacter sp.]|jgi:hypothetical protein|nr:hypothetical protein [Flavisolibacter sp.]
MTIASNNGFNSLFSIKPLVQVLRRMIGEGKPGAKKLYAELLSDLENKPVLLEPFTDEAHLKEHSEVLETVLSTIFPPSTSANEGMYAICFPFRSHTVYASPSFKDQFLLDKDSNDITIAENRTSYTIAKATSSLAYNLILRKFYSWDVPAVASSVHHFPDADTGLMKYLELKLNAQFVEVKLIDPEFSLPTSYTVQRSLDMDELRKTFPIEHFSFEGFVVIEVTDVTSEQAISEIKNTLLHINSFADVTVYDKLQEHIQTFLGLKDVTVGITPFFKINNYYLFSELHYRNSLLFRHEKVIEHKFTTTRLTQKFYKDADQPQLYSNLDAADGHDLLSYYLDQGLKSLIICPLKCEDGQLIGLLEIASEQPGRLRYQHVSKINSAMQLFTLALEKSIEGLELQIDKTIKEHFTAIQPAVEWKFTEAAFEYLQHRQDNDLAKLPAITFDDVYPLYAAIDVKNSSVERNNAIQLDLLEQLNKVRDVLHKGSTSIELPLLKEIQYKVEKFIAATTENLLSEDELQIYEFLQHHIDALFRHLLTVRPELEEPIKDYFASLDPQKQILYHHRKRYEDSITKINDTLDRFMDREQAAVQQIYPHYFERYITDGIEFNIYIGQSLAPHHPFDELYVSNLKMWQLTVLLKAARITHALEKKLALPLQTTQLILAHSIPLSISFRNKERKFDVDGAYNIRYEIVKKRIDKVHTRDGSERLTQPGKIAIVYSQQKELNEYLEYIEYLQNENLIIGEVEHLELEELQGVSGLKGLRFKINYDYEQPAPKVERSSLTSRQLLGK